MIGIGDGLPDLIVHDTESSVEVAVNVAPFDAPALALRIIKLLRKMKQLRPSLEGSGLTSPF